MLKKLRLKFVVLNMATVVVVLAIAFSAILVINHQQNLLDVSEALDAAIEAAAALDDEESDRPDGTSPLFNSQNMLFGSTDGQQEGTPDADGAAAAADAAAAAADAADDAAAAGEGAEADDAQDADAQGQTGTPPEIGDEYGEIEQIIPVAVYIVGSDGTLSAVASLNTASISDSVLSQAADELADAADGEGALNGLGLYYQKRTIEDVTYLAFADMGAASEWQRLALTLVVIGLAAFLVFFIISVFFSRWALRPVDEAWKQQRQFVADASHDLKTPLTVILANTSIVLEHPERSVASQSQWIESTQHEAESMQELVGDLLLLAQLDEGAVERATEDVDLADLAEGEIMQFDSVAFERHIVLEADIEPGVVLHGNPARLRRLVTTLLDNACKYAGADGRVDVALRTSGRNAVFSVHNTGPAIPADELPHVFDRFYRADKARTRNESGHGLGLAIAHSIAEEHGGTLIVASSEAAGTTFTATLPLGGK